jgi:hypothetical protein
MTTTAATTQAEAMPVHDFVWTDGTRVRTTWAETRVEADRIAKQFKRDGAYFSGVFTDSVIGKFRIAGHWKK